MSCAEFGLLLTPASPHLQVQEVTEQLAEFLVKFRPGFSALLLQIQNEIGPVSSDEQYAILTPFLSMLLQTHLLDRKRSCDSKIALMGA